MKTETPDHKAAGRIAAQSEIAQAVKRIVLEFDPGAEVILYGSRARGDAEPDSDWDFLVLTSFQFPFEMEETLHCRIYPVQLVNDAVLTMMVEPKSDWRLALNQTTPFYANVDREGLFL